MYSSIALAAICVSKIASFSVAKAEFFNVTYCKFRRFKKRRVIFGQAANSCGADEYAIAPVIDRSRGQQSGDLDLSYQLTV